MKQHPRSKAVIFIVFLSLFLLRTNPSYGTTDLNQQLDILAKKLASAAKGDVLKGDEAEVYINLGQVQGILAGNKFEIVRQGQPLKVGDEIIGYEETRVAEVEVQTVRDKISICKVSEHSFIPEVGDKAYQLRKKINTLVVGQFTYGESFNRLTKNLQEKLVTAMTNRGMKVVERDQLERVLSEQKLGYSGLVNMESAKKIGELLGAEGMLLGTVNDMGNAITINARLVDIESGKAVSASEVEIAKTPIIAQLLNIPVESSNATYGNQAETSSTFSGVQPQHSTSVFQNDFLQVKLKGIHKSEDMKRVSVSLLIQNISKEEIFLALQFGGHQGPKIALDTYHGEVIKCHRKDFNGLPYINIGQNDKKNYASLGKRAQTVLSCSFSSKEPIKSDVFSISAEMLKYYETGKNEKYINFTVGLADIKLK